jgi:hypothetical protein
MAIEPSLPLAQNVFAMHGARVYSRNSGRFEP